MPEGLMISTFPSGDSCMNDTPIERDEDSESLPAFAEEVRRINVNIPHSMYQMLLVHTKADGVSIRNLIYELLKDYLIKKAGSGKETNLGSVY
jgi:hypothetical protein